MAEIVLRDIEKYFGDDYVIRKLNLDDRATSEFVVLLGPSGCGKTTTLRAIAGLEDIDTGDILIDGKPVQGLTAGDRDIAFVFQLFALYPHLTAYENIAFPLRATRESRAEVDSKVREVARVAAASSTCSSKRPSALSGGDMQRVAIGRALVRRPKAMLMDEPIGALDAKLREDMRAELKRLHIENGVDHGLRHPRPGRGDGARRPHRHHERGRAAAGRHADRGLPAPGQPLRRAVRRQPGDEHRRREVARRGRRRQRSSLGGGASASTFPAELPRQARRGKLPTARAHARHPAGGVLVAREAARGLRAGRGAHHRAARRLRHRRPQGRRAVAAGAHGERLRRAGRRHGLGEARRGADPFLRRRDGRVAATSGSASDMAADPARERHQDLRRAHRAATTSTSTSPTASSSSCSGRPAPARRRRSG